MLQRLLGVHRPSAADPHRPARRAGRPDPAPVNDFGADSFVSLTAGDTLSVQLFGLLGAATIHGGAGGASLNVQRVSAS